jgi:hypothetical protein
VLESYGVIILCPALLIGLETYFLVFSAGAETRAGTLLSDCFAALIIGAHALLRSDRLLTLDAARYTQSGVVPYSCL